jgi:hypothetical protein
MLVLTGAVRTEQGSPPASIPDVTWTAKQLAEKYTETLKLIKPQPGESRWMQIDWLTSLWDARVKAAAAGKPIFVWNGSGGAPMCPT